MKYRLFLIIATFAVLGSTITSCSLDDELRVAPNDGDPKTPISFNVNIGSLPDPIVTNSMTRGYTANTDGTTYTFASTNDDVVAVSLCGVSGSTRLTGESNAETMLYTVSGGSGSRLLSYSSGGTNAFNWINKNEKVSVRAWSFGNSATTDTDPSGQTFAISVSQHTDPFTTELLYSPATTYSYGNIPIPLYHQLARIVVNVKSTLATATSGSNISISGVDIGDGNMPIGATFTRPSSDVYNTWQYSSSAYTNISDGTSRDNVDAAIYGSWGSYGTANQTIHAKAETTTSGYTATYSAVVLPGTYGNASGAAFKFIVISTSNGTSTEGTYAYYIPANSTITLSPGKQYTFNITDLNQIDLKVTVSAWSDDTTNSETITFSN